MFPNPQPFFLVWWGGGSFCYLWLLNRTNEQSIEGFICSIHFKSCCPPYVIPLVILYCIACSLLAVAGLQLQPNYYCLVYFQENQICIICWCSIFTEDRRFCTVAGDLVNPIFLFALLFADEQSKLGLDDSMTRQAMQLFNETKNIKSSMSSLGGGSVRLRFLSLWFSQCFFHPISGPRCIAKTFVCYLFGLCVARGGREVLVCLCYVLCVKAQQSAEVEGKWQCLTLPDFEGI